MSARSDLARKTATAAVAAVTVTAAWLLTATPAAAGCPTTSATGNPTLPSTGEGQALPVVGLGLLLLAVAVTRRRRMLLVGLALAVAAAALSVGPPPALAAAPSPAGCAGGTPIPSGTPATYLVGAAVESINPTPAMIRSGTFHLGGYGFGSGAPGGVQVYHGRVATGILDDGVHVRALAVSSGGKAIVLAQIETQGVFAAYKAGPYGLEDIRRAAAAAALKAHPRGPRLGPGQILIDSNHTHAGPDTAGVWGGVPTAYLQLVKERTVAAITRAYLTLRPAHLWFGTAKGGVAGKDAGALITNQFAADPANQQVDDELRVLQARDARTGKVFLTYLNFSAHPTVLGGDNLLVSADYTGPLSSLLASYGGVGFAQVGTLGRTQPADRGCPEKTLKGPAASRCALKEYATRVFARTQRALAAAQPLTGQAVVDLHSYLITDVSTNAIIIALPLGGFAAGTPIYRQVTPPWSTGALTGTTTYSGRIGPLLISGSPGEPYPQIPLTVRAAVPGMQGYLSIGTAGDFLGYIVAPFEAYPEPIRRTLLTGAPPPGGDTCQGAPSPAGCPGPFNNDNYFFNLSHTFGERTICSLLRGTGEALGKGTTYRAARDRCQLFPNDLQAAPDADTTYDTGPYSPGGP